MNIAYIEPALSIPGDTQPVSRLTPLPVAFYPPTGAALEATLTELDVTVASTTVPQPLSATDLFVDEVSIKAKTANTVYCKLGYSPDNGSQLWELLPTEWRSLKAPAGTKINLKNIYVDVGANGEGVVVHAIG